jgi:hypothetical protein
MKKQIPLIIVASICIRLAVGCATIIHGTTQDIGISSAPDQAEVWIDGARAATTPAKVTLKRKDNYLVTIKKEGYREATVKIEGTTSSWIIGNVIFGGIIGCGVDLLTGGAYDLKPERLDINLTKLADLDGKTIHIDQTRLEKIRQVCLCDGNGKVELVVNISWAE